MQANDIIPLTISAFNAMEDVDATVTVKKEEEGGVGGGPGGSDMSTNQVQSAGDGGGQMPHSTVMEHKEEAMSDDDQVIELFTLESDQYVPRRLHFIHVSLLIFPVSDGDS